MADFLDNAGHAVVNGVAAAVVFGLGYVVVSNVAYLVWICPPVRQLRAGLYDFHMRRFPPKAELWTPVGGGMYYMAPPRWRAWSRRIGLALWGVIGTMLAVSAVLSLFGKL